MRSKLFISLIVGVFAGLIFLAEGAYCNMEPGGVSDAYGPGATSNYLSWLKGLEPEQLSALLKILNLTSKEEEELLELLNQTLDEENSEELESSIEDMEEAVAEAMEELGIVLTSEGFFKDGEPIDGFSYDYATTFDKNGKVKSETKVKGETEESGDGKITYSTVTITREYKDGILVKETEVRDGYEAGDSGDTSLHKDFKTTRVTTYNSLGLVEKIDVDSWNAGEGGGSTVNQVIVNTEWNKYGQADRREITVNVEGGESYSMVQWNIEYENGEIVKYEEKRTDGEDSGGGEVESAGRSEDVSSSGRGGAPSGF